jgi:hypothetical protein
VIVQRLDLRGGIWTCPSCGARLGSGDLAGLDAGASLEHEEDCAEVAGMAGAIPSEIPGSGPSGERVIATFTVRDADDTKRVDGWMPPC